MLRDKIEDLQKYGVDPEKAIQYQVLCLPENIESAGNADELFDANSTAILSKKLKAAGLRCGNSHDLTINCPTLDRRADEIWLGLLWIRDVVAIPIVIAVVSNLLTGMFRTRAKSRGSTTQSSQPKVHLSLRIQRGENLTDLKYDGDPETLRQMLGGIKGDGDLKT